MKIKIFTEGGENIGLGHISRCCSLYDEAYRRGIDVEFIIYGDISHLDLIKNRPVINDNWLSADYLYNNIKSTDYCIVDSYLAPKELYEIISAKAMRALYIDDMARINYPKGIVVNPSLDTENIIYLENNENIYLLGYKYIILRTPFIDTQRNTRSNIVKEVLITMGGSDTRNLTPKIMNNLCNEYPYIKFNVVVNDTFHNIANIEEKKLDNIKLYYNVDEQLMKELMIKSDMAITAAGQTIYELLATETPFIPIKVIDNQSNTIAGLSRINPNQCTIDFDDKDFNIILKIQFEMMLDKNTRTVWMNRFKNLIDGSGRKRIINNLLGE